MSHQRGVLWFTSAHDSPLQMLSCTPVRKLERSGLHRRLRSLVSSHFGPRFDVEDVSMWRFAHDLQDAPLEFAIVVSSSGVIHGATLSRLLIVRTGQRVSSWPERKCWQ